MANTTLNKTGEKAMSASAELGGTFTLPGTTMMVHRMGYGAMQLAGPHVFGPPKDRDAAITVLREAIESGVDHVDTSDFYGPYVTNQIIREALHPYADGLVIVTKVGAKRGADSSWNQATSKEELTAAVHDNLRNLGLERLDVVNLRALGTLEGEKVSLEEPLTVLAELQQQGLIAALGVSNVSQWQYDDAKKIAPIVCVQNEYNLAKRKDDAFVDALAREGVAYVPYFPLGGFTPLQSHVLDDAAKSLGVTPMQLALAWLLHRSANMLLIPGTSSLGHLRENLAAAKLELSPEMLATLDAIAK